MINPHEVHEHLREEFEQKIRASPHPKHITFERGPNGHFIQPVMEFLFAIFCQGATVGAALAIEELVINKIEA